MREGVAHENLDLSVFQLKEESKFEALMNMHRLPVKVVELEDNCEKGENLIFPGHDLYLEGEEQKLIPTAYGGVMSQVGEKGYIVNTEKKSENGMCGSPSLLASDPGKCVGIVYARVGEDISNKFSGHTLVLPANKIRTFLDSIEKSPSH